MIKYTIIIVLLCACNFYNKQQVIIEDTISEPIDIGRYSVQHDRKDYSTCNILPKDGQNIWTIEKSENIYFTYIDGFRLESNNGYTFYVEDSGVNAVAQLTKTEDGFIGTGVLTFVIPIVYKCTDYVTFVGKKLQDESNQN